MDDSDDDQIDSTDDDQIGDVNDGREERTGGSVFDAIRHVLETLREIEQENKRTGHGYGRIPSAGTEYGFSIGVGPGPRPEGPPARRRERSERGSPPRTSGETSPSVLVDVRHTDDEVIVTADVVGVDEDDLTAGVDRETNTLVLAVDGEAIERIPLEWEAVDVVAASLNNGVLELHLRPEEERS